MRKANRSMLEGPLFQNIIFYTIPIILTSLLQLLFNAADLVVVGRFCGSISVAAVGATGAITSLLVNFFIGLSVGAGVTVAHALGGRQEQMAHRAVHTALPCALVCGALLTLAGIFLSPVFLRLTGTPETVLPLSTLYMQIYFGGVTFNMVYNFCASILRAAGDTRSPLVYLTFAGIINVVLNVIFVTAVHMNVAGVALATVISQAISAILVVHALIRRSDACKLELKRLRFYSIPLAKMLRIGLPAGVQSTLLAVSNVMIQSSINSFGDVFMSGNAAAGNLDGFVFASQNAFHQTAVNFIGQNVGAKRYDRVNKAFRICLGSVTVVGLSMGCLFNLFGRSLLSIYITDSPLAIEYGMIRLAYITAPYFLCGLMDVTTGALRGLGYSVIPMIVSILGICGLRILWIYTVFQIPGFHTPQCLFLSYAVSWIVTFLAQFTAFRKVYRKVLQAAA